MCARVQSAGVRLNPFAPAMITNVSAVARESFIPRIKCSCHKGLADSFTQAQEKQFAF